MLQGLEGWLANCFHSGSQDELEYSTLKSWNTGAHYTSFLELCYDLYTLLRTLWRQINGTQVFSPFSSASSQASRAFVEVLNEL